MQEQREQSGFTRGSGVSHEEPQRAVLPRLTASEPRPERTGWSPSAWRTAPKEEQR